MKKKKILGSGGPGGGRNLAQPGAGAPRARARRPSYGPRRKMARAHEGRRRFDGAHASDRAGGGDGANG
jgi:hypothetical protein